MKQIEGKKQVPAISPNATVLPCNFRSAGRLSNESARTLTHLHETLARNLTNSLDVYLGVGLEVRLAQLEQLSMDEFKMKCITGGYMLPCATKPAGSNILLDMDHALMFTVIDLLLGGSGTKLGANRELTEIDEEIMEGVGQLIAQQIERVWQPIGYSLVPGRCVKPNLAHRVFPPTDKVICIQFDVSVAGMTGFLYVFLQASLAGSLVRNIRADNTSNRGGSAYQPMLSLAKRMLECPFNLSGELPNMRVSVRALAGIQEGSILMLSAPVAGPGKLTLEGNMFFDALPVRQGQNKAMQLFAPVTAAHVATPQGDDQPHAGL